MHRTFVLPLVGGMLLLAAAPLQAQLSFEPAVPQPIVALPPATVVGVEGSSGQFSATSTTNTMLWKQYQALQTGTESYRCEQCGGGLRYPHQRCSCNTHMFPWIEGPGNCDSWCVGPKWAVEATGLFLFHDDADWDRVIGDVGLTETLLDQFDHGPGGRVFATAYNDSGFGMQVGYEGVNEWGARAEFEPAAGALRTFDYQTRLNSVEVNFLPRVEFPWKFFSGFRYVEISEDFVDFTTNAKPNPVPVSAPVAETPVVDSGTSFLLKNRLIGFQLGGRRDTWQWGKWLSVETFFNGGVYCNKFKRRDIARTVTTTVYGDDIDTSDVDEFTQVVSTVETPIRRDSARIAFLGEAGITGVVRLNQCVALKSGYQVLVVDGVGQGLDAYFATNLQPSTALYHGLQFGVEYRR